MLRAASIVGKRILAVFLILLGILGLALPVLPGLVLIALGLVLLGIIEKDDVVTWVSRARSWWRRRRTKDL